MASPDEHSPRSGPIAWMTHHTVAANLVMMIFLLGGFLVSLNLKQEIFPEFSVDRIRIIMAYPGASPEEIEQGIILAIESVVRGMDGVKKITSTASEGRGTVAIELVHGVNANNLLQDVSNEIDGIRSFPELAEKPIINLMEVRNQVMTIMVHGDLEEQVLRDVAERVRDDLLQRPGITLVQLGAARPREISIEVPQRHLRAYGLTLNRIAREIGDAAVELPGGGVKTPSGEVLLRTQERRDFGREYAEIPITSTLDGDTITVSDIATIKDGFAETDHEAFYNGQRSISLNVFRVGLETPQSVSDSVHAYLEELRPELPESIGVTIWNDKSELFRDRMALLLKNAFLGLILVLLLLGLFLDLKLAFWVTVGLPVSIIGSFLFIPMTGASINMISLFAFIVTLGIIVDDAVVAGEIIYQKREQGLSPLQAAVVGAREIASPITFAVLTNIAAFLPMFFVAGDLAKFMREVPSVVVAVLVVSLIESLFVLPSHLAHTRDPSWIWKKLDRPRLWFSRIMHTFIRERYQPFLRAAIAYRWVTVAAGVALLILAIGVVAGGHIAFTFLPTIDSEVIKAQVMLPYGTSMEKSRDVLRHLVDSAKAALAQHGGEEGVLRGIFAKIGSRVMTDQGATSSANGSHVVGAKVFLVAADRRDFSGEEFSNTWRSHIGTIPGIESLAFKAATGPSGGAPIEVQLSHRSREILETAAGELAEILSQYAGVVDIDDGVSLGKSQMSFHLKPEARSLGLNATDLAQQVRGAFYGAEALRQQRGRDEVRVMVRLPEVERRSALTVEQLILLTGEGGEIPLAEAAEIESGRAYTEINRREGRRIVSVKAKVDKKIANATKIMGEVTANELKTLLNKYPGLTYSLEGEQSAQQELVSSLGQGFILALLLIYALLAIPFRSYVQPLIVMLCIPFSIIGALIGHLLLGYGLSMVSMFGIVALAGVVVNDSLVLIVATNRIYEEQDVPFSEAIVQGAMSRFRPIVLTSLTTFFGLAPMIFETALQARFLIPMAISLGFGILFGTAIILVLVPCVYLMVVPLLRKDRPVLVGSPAS